MARTRNWYSKEELKDAKIVAKAAGMMIWKFRKDTIHRDGTAERIDGLYVGIELPKSLKGERTTAKVVFPRK